MFRKNTAGQFIHFQGVTASTGGILTGATFTARRCIDGTFAAATGTVTEDTGIGFYKFAMSQADTNGNNIGFNFTATNAVPQTVNIVTTACDPTTATNFGITGIPAVATGTAGALLVDGTGTAAISNSAGKVLLQATQSGVTIPTVTTVTNQLTAAAIATGVWTDTTAGDFTTALSIGKSVMNGVALGTGLTINAYTGNTVQTGDSFVRIGAAGVSLTAVALADATSDAVIADAVWNAATVTYGAAGSYGLLVETDLDAAISSRMATYTQPTGFLAATFPTGTIANTTNITAGTITTVTTLTGHTPQTGDTFALANGVNGFVATKADTAAIKVQTDKLTFTVAGRVDANSTYLNGAALTGNGSAGLPWGPA